MLTPQFFSDLLNFTDVETFEIASDAFLTLKELLTKHPGPSSVYMSANSAPFFAAFNTKLLVSPNYVTRRQSLKLLSDLLLTPGNVELMMAYIRLVSPARSRASLLLWQRRTHGELCALCSDVSHLALMMKLLRDESRSIAFEAFHIFKACRPLPTPRCRSRFSRAP